MQIEGQRNRADDIGQHQGAHRGLRLGVICGLDAKARGYVNPKDLLTYDKAMRMLGIKSRNKFSSLCRENGISNVRINNMRVGFRREDIERLYDIVSGNH